MDIAFIVDDINRSIGLEQAAYSYIVTLFASSKILIVMNINIAVHKLVGSILINDDIQRYIASIAVAENDIAIISSQLYLMQLIEPATQIDTIIAIIRSIDTISEYLQSIAYAESIAISISNTVIIGFIHVAKRYEISLLRLHATALEQDIAVRF